MKWIDYTFIVHTGFKIRCKSLRAVAQCDGRGPRSSYILDAHIQKLSILRLRARSASFCTWYTENGVQTVRMHQKIILVMYGRSSAGAKFALNNAGEVREYRVGSVLAAAKAFFFFK